jgi:hypothetical protein
MGSPQNRLISARGYEVDDPSALISLVIRLSVWILSRWWVCLAFFADAVWKVMTTHGFWFTWNVVAAAVWSLLVARAWPYAARSG